MPDRNVQVYYEDGPLKDEVHERTDAPSIIRIQTAKKPGMSFVADLLDGDPAAGPGYVDIETLAYHREVSPHRTGVVCYWTDEKLRDRAHIEDTFVSEGPMECLPD